MNEPETLQELRRIFREFGAADAARAIAETEAPAKYKANVKTAEKLREGVVASAASKLRDVLTIERGAIRALHQEDLLQKVSLTPYSFRNSNIATNVFEELTRSVGRVNAARRDINDYVERWKEQVDKMIGLAVIVGLAVTVIVVVLLAAT